MQRHLIDVTDLTRADIESLLAQALAFKQAPYRMCLPNTTVASCFFEASTRTRLSFEAAAHRLGASVIGFSDAKTISQVKGECLEDSIRIVSSYADLLVLRHPQAGSAQVAAAVSQCPVINAGDGDNQHPTQTLLDLFSMQETQGRLTGLKIGLVGDLKYGRTVHSLLQAGALFNMQFMTIPQALSTLPEPLSRWLSERGCAVSMLPDLTALLETVDILYVTRIQKERFSAQDASDDTPCVLTPTVLKAARPTLKVLHPLPRVGEIHPEVDNMPCAYYFQQAANGVPVRQALLAALRQSGG